MNENSPELIPLALLDGYKVRWSRETVARDIVQNFFDEVDDFTQVEITVDAKKKTVEVRGPSRFDLEYLKYIGATTKTLRRSAGGFGEGFKVCALVLLRDFRCEVTAGSGAWAIRPILRPMKLGRELCYEVQRLAPEEEHPGSFVRLGNADARLCEVFSTVKDLFRHPGNPRLTRPLHVDAEAGVGIYQPTNEHFGHLYYRRQHRGLIRYKNGGGLTFAFDDRLDKLEGDRDRRDLSAAVPMVAALAQRLPDAMIEQMIRHLRAYWQVGGRILGAFITEAKRRGLEVSFPRRWLARVRHGYQVEAHAERIGFHLGVEKLGEIGMPSVEDRFGKSSEPRLPTALEGARVAVASDLYARLAGQAPLFARFRVVDIEKSHVDVGERSCVMVARHLAAPFGEGIAPCLSALACGVGQRSRRNADRLTALLEGAMRLAGTLEPYAERWAKAADDPAIEAFDPGADEDEDSARVRGDSIPVSILAPTGFPPSEALLQRIKRLCKEERVGLWSLPEEVNNARGAVHSFARGIPSVWIGGKEIEARRGSRPSFTVRSFEGPDGARALLPGDEALRAAIRVAAVAMRRSRAARRAQMGVRHTLAEPGWRRWLAREAPDEHRRLVLDKAIDEVISEMRKSTLGDASWELSRVIWELTRRELEGHALDPVTLPEATRAAFVRARAQALLLLTRLEAAAEGVTQDDPPHQLARGVLLKRVDAALEKGAPVEQAFQLGVDAAPTVTRVAAWMDEAPLDSTCSTRCIHEALDLFWELRAERGDEAALHEARERFAAAVEHALARHQLRDEDGQPPSCYTIGQALDLLFGRKKEGVEPPPSPVAVAVCAAWEQAIAEGATELQAAARCLDIASQESARLGKKG